MRTLFSIIFTLCAIATSAQTTPPSVVRSSSATTQVDPYLTALRRLGIPTVAGDSLEATGTPQNSMKLIYNTALGKLRVYNPSTGLWSDASPASSPVTASNGLQIMGDSSIGLGGVIDEITDIIVMPYSSLNIYDEDNIIGLSHTGSSVEMRGDNAMLAMGDDIALSAPKSTLASSDYVVMVDSMGGGANRQLRLVPKSDFSSGGNYLPLDIQDSTTVELNGNSVMFKGDNHSLVMNTPFDALAIAEAVMDGFRAQQYDGILTMNGIMKVPLGFGDTTRYPVMFVSHGMPFSDTARFALIRGILDNEFGFAIQVADEPSEEEIAYEFLNDKFSIIKNENSVFEIDLSTGIIDAPYVGSKDSTNIAQVQDIIDLTSPNIITVDTSTYNIGSGVSSIVTLVDGSEFVHLPFVSNAIGKSIHIINNSSNAVDIMSASLTDIWQNGLLVNTVTLPSGSTMMLINNGSYWAIF